MGKDKEKKEKKEKKEEDEEDEGPAKIRLVSPIANPLASKKLTKKVRTRLWHSPRRSAAAERVRRPRVGAGAQDYQEGG